MYSILYKITFKLVLIVLSNLSSVVEMNSAGGIAIPAQLTSTVAGSPYFSCEYSWVA